MKIKISIKYNKKRNCFIVLLNKYVFLTHKNLKYKKNRKIKNISIVDYNYFLVLKILRLYGLKKPYFNYKDFF